MKSKKFLISKKKALFINGIDNALILFVAKNGNIKSEEICGDYIIDYKEMFGENNCEVMEYNAGFEDLIFVGIENAKDENMVCVENLDILPKTKFRATPVKTLIKLYELTYDVFAEKSFNPNEKISNEKKLEKYLNHFGILKTYNENQIQK